MRRVAVLVFSLLSISTAAQERFVNRALNWSAVAPQGWQWSEVRPNQTWVARGPRGERITVYASAATRARVEESWLTELLPSINRDAAADGAQIRHYMQRRATAPLFPSLRYSYTRVSADGKQTFIDGYVACSGRMYSLEYSSPSRESLPEFQAFVRSFQIVDKFASQRGARASQAASGLPQNGTATDVLGRPLGPNQGGPSIR